MRGLFLWLSFLPPCPPLLVFWICANKCIFLFCFSLKYWEMTFTNVHAPPERPLCMGLGGVRRKHPMFTDVHNVHGFWGLLGFTVGGWGVGGWFLCRKADV